jgi:hypothetical protein
MRQRYESKILLRVALGVLAITTLATCIAPAVADTVLFMDTFTYPTPGPTAAPPDPGYVSDINTQIGYAGRQSGSMVDLNGPITYTQADHGGGMVLGYSGAQNGVYEVIQSWNGGIFSPNMNFNNEKSAGGLIISFDAANWSPWGDAANLATASIGLGAAPTNSDPAMITTWTASHFSLEYGYGAYWPLGSCYGTWDSGTSVAGDYMVPSVADNGLHHVELVCTDTSGHDNNPFDGEGNTHIEVYINPTVGDTSRGSLVAEYTKDSGGYTDNYIALGGYHYEACAQEWDNLTVTQVPEPSSLALVTMGLVGWFWLKRR